MNDQPLCIDLYAGLGGWAEGFLAEGWRVIGFDIERHDYGTGGYPGQLVLQDVLTLHGSQFRNADCIVASPPCQEFSYMAMPWKRAKQIAAALRGRGEFPEGYTGSRAIAQLNALFDACFRIQREACEAANGIRSWGADCEAFGSCGRAAITIGHFGKPICAKCSEWAWKTYGPPINEGPQYRYIPLVVENVKGAQRWVGRAAGHYGSFYLWGDMPALMPSTSSRKVIKAYAHSGSWKTVDGEDWRDLVNTVGRKVLGMNFPDHEKTGKPGRSFQSATVAVTGLKVTGDWFGSYAEQKAAGTISPGRLFGKHSQARKAASAQIAKIPFELARWIAATYKPDGTAA